MNKKETLIWEDKYTIHAEYRVLTSTVVTVGIKNRTSYLPQGEVKSGRSMLTAINTFSIIGLGT